MSEALNSINTILKIGDGATPTEVFTAIAEVKDIAGPQLSTDTVDITSRTSPGKFEEALPTIIRTGQVTFDINFLPTNGTHDAETGLLADLKNMTKRNFQLVFPDAAETTWSFSAYVVQFQPNAPVAGVLSASVALKITGQPTFSAA